MDHSHDHAHDHHGHGHSHGHGHDHSHDGDYYLNQLLTVFICGAFGTVAVRLYQTLDPATGRGMLDKLLAERFQLPVLLGGIGLLLMVVIRGACLWQSAGARHTHHDHAHDHKPGEPCDHPSHHVGHDHKPGEKCDHPSHAHAGHDHGDHSAEDHDHGNVYWRVLVLLFPLALFMVNVPNKGFSARWLKEYLGEEEALKYSNLDVAEKSGVKPLFSFKQLNDEARSETNRAALIGTRIALRGQFSPVGPKEFSLVFLSMTCCPADNEPLRARIVVPGASSMPAVPVYSWVTVDGVIAEFAQTTKGEWVTIIRSDANGVKPTDPGR